MARGAVFMQRHEEAIKQSPAPDGLQPPVMHNVSQRDHMDKSEQRIHAVLGDDNERTPKNARRYLVHLKEHLSLPLRVTGVEDFPWEEPYVLGGWGRTT